MTGKRKNERKSWSKDEVGCDVSIGNTFALIVSELGSLSQSTHLPIHGNRDVENARPLRRHKPPTGQLTLLPIRIN